MEYVRCVPIARGGVDERIGVWTRVRRGGMVLCRVSCGSGFSV